MCLKRGTFLREGSQRRHLKRCPMVGRITWGCSRHLCLGPFRPSLRSTNLGFCLALTELQACTRDHNSTEESLATVSPGVVSPKPTPSSLSPNMCHPLLCPLAGSFRLFSASSTSIELSDSSVSVPHWAGMLLFTCPVLLRKRWRCSEGPSVRGILCSCLPLSTTKPQILEVNSVLDTG